MNDAGNETIADARRRFRRADHAHRVATTTLSRIIAHVKEQNWTAIVLDFVIVVMGVFIGLQVNKMPGRLSAICL